MAKKKKAISIIKLHLFLLSLFSLSLSLLIYISITLQLKTHPSVFFNQLQLQQHPHIKKFNHLSNSIHQVKETRYSSLPFDYLKEKFRGKEIKIGLVNMHVLEEVEEWKGLGTRTTTTMIHFDSVSKDRRWEDYFPEWIDEDEQWNAPKCPEIPMPHFENYGEFNLVVVKVPCGNDQVKGQGVRDVFRLQVNLVVANLVVNNGDDDQNVFIVFIGLCGPMMEIFRCDDLVRHEGEFWIYKPDLRRLKQKVIMPVGSCQLATSHKNQGEEKVTYDFSKLSKSIDHPKEAYVTILHSSEAYVCGAIVLAQSIIQSNSTKDLVLLADKSIGKKSRQALKAAGWKIKIIKRIRSPHAKRDAYNEWNYSKLRIWKLTAYDKIIFIDSDLIILKNIDKFFLYPQLSAIGNDKMLFNSGIMLVEPSECVFKRLMKEMYTLISYNGGDQGFLNEAFTWWHRWPRRLNFLKIFKGESNKQHNVPKCVYSIHYLGLKPWMCYRDYDCNWDMLDHNRYASDSAHMRWWQVYDAMPKKLHSFCGLTKSMDARIKKWRRRAENASLPDRHYMIKVKDPRQHNCKGSACGSLTYKRDRVNT